jgi:type I restriction enzyme S subunit
MNQGRLLTTTSEQITDVAVRETGGRRAEPGTILLSFKLSIGKVGIVGIPMFTNEAIAALPVRDESQLDPNYLAWALDALDLASGANRAAMGATLNKAKLANVAIPLPPLDEQRRIARVLDVADRVRNRRRATVNVLEELRTAAFASTVVASDGSWPLVPVATLVDESNGGIRTGPFGSQLLHSEFVEDGVAVLGIDNAVANEFRWGVERHITEAKYAQLRRYTVHPGDVLITIMGTCGRVAVVPDDIGRAINTKHLCCITLDRSRCLPEFLYAYFLRHPIARHHLASRAKGAIMAGLNMTIIKELPVSLPPIDVQNELVERLAAVDRAYDRAALQREHLDSLFKSLEQRAFAGAL